MGIQRLITGKLGTKLKEALTAVLPILVIVMILGFTLAPIPTSVMLCFMIGAVMLILGMMFFTLGSEMSLSTIGEKVGAGLTKSKKILLIVSVTFVLGAIITIAEPDLTVLANQVPSIPNAVLILAVAIGVGFFLVTAILRMLFKIELSYLLLIFYILVFILSIFVPEGFIAVAFDSGGVTTGPMTVPFIMALGVGVAAIRSDSRASDDSFGLVSLCSVGPILAVMVLSLIYNPSAGSYSYPEVPTVSNSVELAGLFGHGIPEYMGEIAISLLPILIFFIIFQLTFIKMSRSNVKRIFVGMGYTYIGLVLFLTGVNIGFLPAGHYLGQILAGNTASWIIVPIAMLMGYFVVKAEPAVYVLNKQVEEMTDGGISAKTMGTALSVGVAASLGIAMIRVLTGISIMWFIIPGYTIALGITFFVPKIYTAIAFDSGGVASGPMTAAFLLPFAQGACLAVGGDIVKDAFGVVAMVAMTPPITIQVLGLVSKIKAARKTDEPSYAPSAIELLDDDAIIEL